MVGGKQEVFDKYKDLLGAMGASVVRCGDVGAGNTTKLANQIIVACNIQALSEALTLAKMAGVEPELVFQAIKGGLAGSTVMNAKAPMMIEGNDKPGFKIDLHIKDLNNAPGLRPHRGAPPAHDRPRCRRSSSGCTTTAAARTTTAPSSSTTRSSPASSPCKAR